jgi:hypothetical protein
VNNNWLVAGCMVALMLLLLLLLPDDPWVLPEMRGISTTPHLERR